MRDHHRHRCLGVALATALVAVAAGPAFAAKPADGPLFHDAHFHLTNYVQKGTDMGQYVDEIMGDKVGRSTVFGIPLRRRGRTATRASSRDLLPAVGRAALLLLVHRCLYRQCVPQAQAEQRKRLDPMITGFNPADMYAVDHIRRVLETYPGVFTGIGEFTIHKEFVSSKVAGEIASLTDPALDRILDFAGETGLVVILHSDIDMPFAKAGTEPVFLTQMKDLLRRHPEDHDHLGAHRARTCGASGAEPGNGGDDGAKPGLPRARRGNGERPDAEPRLLRHLLGRSGEVRRVVAGVPSPTRWRC